MKMANLLRQQASLLEHWAQPDIQHAPTPDELLEIARLIREAATLLIMESAN